VLACRNYNKALACYEHILAIIRGVVPEHSLSLFVKKIPQSKKAEAAEAQRNDRKLADGSNYASGTRRVERG